MDTCIVGSELHVTKYMKDHDNGIAKRHFCPPWTKKMIHNWEDKWKCLCN